MAIATLRLKDTSTLTAIQIAKASVGMKMTNDEFMLYLIERKDKCEGVQHTVETTVDLSGYITRDEFEQMKILTSNHRERIQSLENLPH